MTDRRGKLWKRYNELFTEKDKANAFDKLAEQFYLGNFGRMAKADLETLMFSLYIEQILEKDQYAFQTYSDYTLSTELGITQSRISSLKVRKQLQYPRDPEKYDWKESFLKIAQRKGSIQYENGKIQIQLSDINLYNEVKNAVEEDGSYIEVTLTKNLLKISPGSFLRLLEIISPDKERKTLQEEIKLAVEVSKGSEEAINEELNRKSLKQVGKDLLIEILGSMVKSKTLAEATVDFLLNVKNAMTKE